MVPPYEGYYLADACDDIYYGDIDKYTGKFEVSVPEECCWNPEPGIDCPCDYCDGEEFGVQPSKFKIIFSGLEPCFSDGCYDAGGDDWRKFYLSNFVALFNNIPFILPQAGTCGYEFCESITPVIHSENHYSLDNCTHPDPYIEWHTTICVALVILPNKSFRVACYTNVGWGNGSENTHTGSQCYPFGWYALLNNWEIGGHGEQCAMFSPYGWFLKNGNVHISIPPDAENLCTD